MKTRDDKLANIEVSLKRWMTRGFRAQRAIDKLLKQRRRLLKAEEPKPSDIAVANMVQAIDDQLTNIVEGKPADPLEIPAAFRRPLLAEDMTAKRKAEEAEQRKAMPLTGRAAMAAIRGPKKRKA